MRTLHIATLNNAQPIYIHIVPSTDKFSRRFTPLLYRIVNHTVQKHYSDEIILFFSSHGFALHNVASVALFSHIAYFRDVAKSTEAFR